MEIVPSHEAVFKDAAATVENALENTEEEPLDDKLKKVLLEYFEFKLEDLKANSASATEKTAINALGFTVVNQSLNSKTSGVPRDLSSKNMSSNSSFPWQLTWFCFWP